MLWLKAAHVFFVIAWFAGLFYLPRLYVYHALSPEPEVRARLRVMERKLFWFVTPIGLLALVTGLWLWLGFGFAGGWLWAKLALVVLLVADHVYLGVLLRGFQSGHDQHGHVFYRWLNELPVLILAAIVILVIVKPF